MVAAIAAGIHWRPGIGDPTVVGWLTVGAYLLTAWFCLRAARASQGVADPTLRRRAALLWYLLAGVLLTLAINKQLDLQTLLTEVGRALAKAHGWYGLRRKVQAAFILVLVAGGCTAALAFALITAPVLRQARLAFYGLLVVLVFVLIRASSFHHVDQLLGWSLGGVKLFGIMEFAGAACIAVSAWRYAKQVAGPAEPAAGNGAAADGLRSGPFAPDSERKSEEGSRPAL